jgi:transcriptional regulator with XRE-family HTH domain
MHHTVGRVRAVTEHLARRRVRMFLAARGIDQTDLAPVLGMSRNSLSRRVNGPTPFRIEELEKIARYLGMPIGELLGTDLDLTLTVADLLGIKMDGVEDP